MSSSPSSDSTITMDPKSGGDTYALSFYYLLHGSLNVLPGLAISQVMMDVLRVQPAEMSFATSLLWIPWTLKPLFGYMTDRLSFCGGACTTSTSTRSSSSSSSSSTKNYRQSRLPYLVVGLTAYAASWFALCSLLPFLNHSNRYLFYGLLFIGYTAFVLAETTVDAILATKAHEEETAQEDQGRLQSGVWTLDAAGSVTATLAVTLVYSAYDEDQNGEDLSTSTTGSLAHASAGIFLACGILSATLLVVVVPWIQQDDSEDMVTDNNVVAVPSQTQGETQTENDNSSMPTKTDEPSLSLPSPIGAAQNTMPPEVTDTIDIPPSFSDLFFDPRLVNSLIFVFLVSSSPTSGDAFFYYQRDVLKFSLPFLASMSVARTCLNLIAAFCYWKWWRTVEYRVVFRNAILLSFFVGIVNVMVTERWNLLIGIPDHAFILGDTVVQGISGEIIFMPVAVLAAKLSRKGWEGTVYATTMSVVNVSWMFSAFFSGILASLFGVQEGKYVNITKLIVVVNIFTLLPLLFLKLVPSMKDQVQYQSVEHDDNTTASELARLGTSPTERNTADAPVLRGEGTGVKTRTGFE